MRHSVPHPDYEFAILLKGNERRFELVRRYPNAEPILHLPSPTFPRTPEGQRKKEEFQKLIEDGARVELSQENIPFTELPEALRVLFSFVEDAPYTISIGPSRLMQPISVSLMIEGDCGESLTLPTIEFTESQGGVESITLSNESQPIPLKIFLRSTDKDRRLRFSYTLHLANHSVYWLVQAIRLQNILSTGARFVIRDLKTGIVLASFRILPNQVEEWGQAFLHVASNILEIQDAVQKTIVVPERSYFTNRDIVQTGFIRRIIDTGKHPYNTEDVKVTFWNDPGAAQTLLDDFQKEPGPDFCCRIDDHIEELLGQNISLGPMETRIPVARLSSEDLEKLRLCATGKSRRKQFALRILPSEGHSIEVTFPKWLTRKNGEPTAQIKDEGSSRRPPKSHQQKGTAAKKKVHR